MVGQEKGALRKYALEKRWKISDEDRHLAERKWLSHAQDFVSTFHQNVFAGYWPIKGEIDIRPLFSYLTHHNHSCALPQVIEFKKPLTFRAWHDGLSLTEGRYGIREPDPSACEVIIPDIIFTPMLGFDRRGHRLGYGSGFYDRTFSAFQTIHHRFLAVGVAFDIQELAEVPSETYDYLMDFIITESGIQRIEKGKK